MSSSLVERLIMKRQLFFDIARYLFSDVAPSVPILETSVLQSDVNELCVCSLREKWVILIFCLFFVWIRLS